MDDLVAQNLEKLRRYLIDLSGRNSLLNFRFSERSRTQVRLIDELPDQVFKKLDEGSALTVISLPPLPDNPTDEDGDNFRLLLEAMRNEDEDYRTAVADLDEVDCDSEEFQQIERKLRDKVRKELGMPARPNLKSLSKTDYARTLTINPDYDLPASRVSNNSNPTHYDKKLQTLLYPDELERKLAGLREGARKSIQETGLNTLYLAFGMLEWYESDQSDKRLLAPLLLYPIALERQLRNGRYHYSIKSFGEELEENVSLSVRLQRDFGIVLPPFMTENEETTNTPEAYFEKVSQLIHGHSRWKVRRFLTLSLFSFKGITLFQDLNPERWPNEASLLKHPLISSILCGQKEKSQGDVSPEDYEVDQPEITRKVPLLITDADASQFSAIVDVLDGKDLVIKGPPGTGKSQTITNLIAAALAKGKKILFVAEKKAALEVVYNRLSNAGLENYCLEIHSTATSKQSFYEKLKQRVEQPQPPDVSDALKEQIDECGQLKQKLSQYVQLLNQPFGRIGKTVQELFWSVQRAKDSVANFALPSTLPQVRDSQARSMTSADFKRKCQHLKEFCQQYQNLIQTCGQVENHPWFGLTAHDLSPIEQGDLLGHAKMWSKSLRDLLSASQSIAEKLELEEQPKLADVQYIYQQLKSCPKMDSKVVVELMPVLKIPQNSSSITSLINQLRKFRSSKKAITQFFEERVNSDELTQFRSLFEEPQDSAYSLEDIATALKILRAQFPQLCDPSHHSLLVEAKANQNKLKSSQAALRQDYNLYACQNPTNMHHYARKLRQANFLSSLFDSEYRDAKKLWEKIQKKSSHLSDVAIARVFEGIAQFQTQLDNFKNSSSLQQVCGKLFRELETNFDALLAMNSFASGLIQQFEEIEDIRQKIDLSDASDILGYFYQEEETNLERLEITINFVKSVLQSQLSQPLKDKLLTQNSPLLTEEIQKISQNLSGLIDKEIQYRQDFFQLSKLDTQAMFGCQDITDLHIGQLAERVERTLMKESDLPTWINYHRIYQQVADDGMESLIDAFKSENLTIEHLEVTYDLVFYQSLLRFAYEQYPELNQFSGVDQNYAREQFQKADKKLLHLYQQQLVAQLAEIPIEPGNGRGRRSEWTDLALIRLEIQKQRRHTPQRDFFRRASVALQQLKPCWMMSPSSVAQFIPPGAVTFDLVIIDEASQMRPEEAIGSIARAKQLVVVGDPEQLPPTNFFRVNIEPPDDDVKESDDLDDESILEMSLISNPVRCLKWHYRSRHESLIAFSNEHFYENELTVFPSPNRNFAVEYHYVQKGSYRAGTNLPEVMNVAEAAADFMRLHPQLSLGIVTLNQKQQELLSDEMDRLFALHPELEKYRAARENTLESFFIKNIENVQGDERDVIFISTVYGPERPGMPVMQRFGPINSKHGHRRLNVLFTRAKERVVVFSSMQPSDIRPEQAQNDGVRILREYLEYAQTQRLKKLSRKTNTAITSRDADSDFEIFVAERLRRHGYEVVPQVGVSGYFIDLAVVDPRRSDAYLLGVECDGATYHSSKAARDRDRLRQQVLENLGWNIYRIWSTDWFSDPAAETEKLVAHIQSLLL